jgi:hypothetical protein
VGGWGVAGELALEGASVGLGGFKSSVFVTSGGSLGLEDAALGGDEGGVVLGENVVSEASVTLSAGKVVAGVATAF